MVSDLLKRFWRWFIWHFDKDAVVAHFQGKTLIRGLIILSEMPEQFDMESLIRDYREGMAMVMYHGSDRREDET